MNSSIVEYRNWLHAHPKRANKKIVAVYDKLYNDLMNGITVQYRDEKTEEIVEKKYIFDEEKATRPIKFIEQFCKHSKGKFGGKPIKLELFQKAMIEAAYGFVDEEDGYRKYNKVVFFVAKKNGKSTLVSGLGLFGLMADNEAGAEVYSVAKVKDQAKIVWKEAGFMLDKSPALAKRVRKTISGFYFDSRDAKFEPLASQTNSLDGKNPSCVLCDEVWAWEDMSLLTIMEDGMSSREQPLLFETSTMGTVRNKVFDHEYDYCSRVIKGYLGQEGGITDEKILPVIYELDDQSEWLDEEAWYKANPALGVSKKIEYIREKVQKAQNNPIDLVNTLCKDFNVRQTSLTSWLTWEDLNNESTYAEEEFKDCYCIGGVDLSSTTDLTAATLIGKKNDKWFVKQMCWIPESVLDQKVKEDKIPYDKWKAQKIIRTCEGSRVNYSDVTNWFIEQVEIFGLRPLWVGYDSWSAQYWKEEMRDYGFDMVEVRQGAKTFSSPMKVLKADLIDKKLNYNNSPVLKWCLSNLSIKADENENIRPVKEHITQRIDAAVSLLDAYCVLYEHEQDYLNMVER